MALLFCWVGWFVLPQQSTATGKLLEITREELRCSFYWHVLTQISFSPLHKPLVIQALPTPPSLQITMGMPIQKSFLKNKTKQKPSPPQNEHKPTEKCNHRWISHGEACKMQSYPHDAFSPRGLDFKTLIKHKVIQSSHHSMTPCSLKNIIWRPHLLSFRKMIIVWPRNSYLVMKILAVHVNSLFRKDKTISFIPAVWKSMEAWLLKTSDFIFK